MDNRIGIEIKDGGFTYRVIRNVGRWGPTFEYSVYECTINFEDEVDTNNKAIKILSSAEGLQSGIWHAFNTERNEMIDCFIDSGMQTNLLLFNRSFISNINNVQNLCIVFDFQEILSLRTFMHFDRHQRFARGFTIPQIRKAVSNMVKAVSDLHHYNLAHTQLTAGHIVCSPVKIKLAALCTAFELDIHADPAAHQFLPCNRISDWGRAPEIDYEDHVHQPPRELEEAAAAEGDDDQSKLNSWHALHNTSRDVWSIGVVALELAYGRIQVLNRNQFLSVVNYIQELGILPDTWEQLLENSEAQMPIHGLAARFTNQYIEFVRLCLRQNPYNRPNTAGLLDAEFLNEAGMMTDLDFVAEMLP